MLTFEQIKELIELVAVRRLNGLEIERAGFRFKIDGHGPQAVAAAPSPSVETPAPATVSTPTPPVEGASVGAPTVADAATPAEGHRLTSPIVGTFYVAPSTDTPAFAQVGDAVRKGQVLCIVEAMKLMNEIESDVDGVVVEVLPQNGQPVEFGEPLFVIKTN